MIGGQTRRGKKALWRNEKTYSKSCWATWPSVSCQSRSVQVQVQAARLQLCNAETKQCDGVENEPKQEKETDRTLKDRQLPVAVTAFRRHGLLWNRDWGERSLGERGGDPEEDNDGSKVILGSCAALCQTMDGIPCAWRLTCGSSSPRVADDALRCVSAAGYLPG